jgi:Tfp pilus assembly protein PilN
MQALQAIFRQHGARLGSVTGELVQVFNANRHGLSSQRSVLAVACPAGTQLGLIVEGGFTALRFEPGVREPTPLLERSEALMRCAGFAPDSGTKYYADETLAPDPESPWAGRTPRLPWLQRLMANGDMARLDLDLSPTRPRVPLTSWLLLAVGALAATFAMVQFQTASAERGREARSLSALEASLNEPAGRSATAATPQDARTARESAAALRELQVPWANLLLALESVAGRNVALLSIEPSAQRQEVRITAEAKNSAAMLDFLDSLRAQSLRDVALTSHQVQSQAGAPIRFQARAQWDVP